MTKSNKTKQSGRLHTLWIFIKSAWYLAETCSHAIIKNLTGSINRDWVNYKYHRMCHNLVKAAQIDLTINNPHQVNFEQSRPIIVMCNHASLYDIPLSSMAVPGSIRMLAKKELFKIPIFGQGMRAAEFPLIDRFNREQAIKNMQMVKDLMNSGIIVWMAPEGTRSKTGELGKFKKGGFITAIQTNALIIPLGIVGSNKVMPAKTWHLNLHQQVTINIGQPIDASEYSIDTRNQLTEKVHESIKSLIE